jgi:DNA-binding phage protein
VGLSFDSDPTDVGKNRHLSAGERLAAFLRRRHPYKTAAHVAALAGVAPAAIEKMLEREALPSFATLGRLLAAYGPALLAETMDHPPAWLLEAAARRDQP